MTTPPFWSAGILQMSRTTWWVVADWAMASRRRTVSRTCAAGEHGGVSSPRAAPKSPSMVWVGAGKGLSWRGDPNRSSSQGWVGRPESAELAERVQGEQCPGRDAGTCQGDGGAVGQPDGGGRDPIDPRVPWALTRG